MSISIKNATTDDLDAIDNVQRTAFIKELWEPVSLFENIMRHGQSFCSIALSEDRCAGYLLAYPTDRSRKDFEHGPRATDTKPDCLYLHDLCVSPDFRGMKVAQQLLQNLEAQTRAYRLPQIIGISVQDSVSFWEKSGFTTGAGCTYHDEPACFITKNIS